MTFGHSEILARGTLELRVSVKRREALLLFFQDKDRLVLVPALWKRRERHR
jgi:hypothetical protein